MQPGMLSKCCGSDVECCLHCLYGIYLWELLLKLVISFREALLLYSFVAGFSYSYLFDCGFLDGCRYLLDLFLERTCHLIDENGDQLFDSDSCDIPLITCEELISRTAL